MQLLGKIVSYSLKKLNIHLSNDLAILLPSREMKRNERNENVFTEGLCTNVHKVLFEMIPNG